MNHVLADMDEFANRFSHPSDVELAVSIILRLLYSLENTILSFAESVDLEWISK